MSSRIAFVVAFTALLVGCGPKWEACEIDDAEGQPSCVEFGSAFQESELGFDSCEDAGGAEGEGSCADLGYSCAAGGDPGEFLEDAECSVGG